ncbi:hypothetical protein L2D75_32150, partial [Pseudomonas aeruginosa]
ELGEELKAAEFVSRELNAFSNEIKGKTPTTAIGSLWFGAIIAVRARALRHHLIAEARRLIRIEGKARGWSWWQRRQGLRKITQ